MEQYINGGYELNPDLFLEGNLKNVSTELINFVERKIDTVDKKWFKNYYVGYLLDIDSVLNYQEDIYCIPQGLVSELFFYNACKEVGIDCEPSTGNDDVIGIDFRIQDEKEARVFGITTNTSETNMRRRISEGNFPVLFVDWIDRKYRMSYFEKFLKYGVFNGDVFLGEVINMNEEILSKLENDIEVQDRNRGRNKDLNFPKGGIQYYNNYKNTLNLLKRNLIKSNHRFPSVV